MNINTHSKSNNGKDSIQKINTATSLQSLIALPSATLLEYNKRLIRNEAQQNIDLK